MGFHYTKLAEQIQKKEIKLILCYEIIEEFPSERYLFVVFHKVPYGAEESKHLWQKAFYKCRKFRKAPGR